MGSIGKAGLAVGLLALLALATAAREDVLAAGSRARITVRVAVLRGEASLFSAGLAELAEGDAVVIEAASGAWYRVRAGTRTGYLHASTVQDAAAVKLAGGAGGATTVTHAERTAAARGFNPDVEARHRRERPLLEPGYDAVDRLEALQIPTEAVGAFRAAGGLAR